MSTQASTKFVSQQHKESVDLKSTLFSEDAFQISSKLRTKTVKKNPAGRSLKMGTGVNDSRDQTVEPPEKGEIETFTF